MTEDDYDSDQDIPADPIHPADDPSAFEPSGFFAEPFWLRLPLVFFVLPISFGILSASWQVIRSQEPFLVAIAMLGLEPLGAFLALASGALIAPRSFFGRWFQRRRRAVFGLIVLWVLALSAISFLVTLGVLK
jgi:hypothetical protein